MRAELFDQIATLGFEQRRSMIVLKEPKSAGLRRSLVVPVLEEAVGATGTINRPPR